MLATDRDDAQICLILVSDDEMEIASLTDDLAVSQYKYFLHVIENRVDLLNSVKSRAVNCSSRPMILVINYGFAAEQSEKLLRFAAFESRTLAMECVVTSPPSDEMTRAKFRDLGATLLESDIFKPGRTPIMDYELTIH